MSSPKSEAQQNAKLLKSYKKSLGFLKEIYENELEYHQQIKDAIVELNKIKKLDYEKTNIEPYIQAMERALKTSLEMKKLMDELQAIIPKELTELSKEIDDYNQETQRLKGKMNALTKKKMGSKPELFTKKDEEELTKLQEEIAAREKQYFILLEQLQNKMLGDESTTNTFVKVIPILEKVPSLLKNYYDGKREAANMYQALFNEPSMILVLMDDATGMAGKSAGGYLKEHRWLKTSTDVFKKASAIFQRSMRVSMPFKELQNELQTIQSNQSHESPWYPNIQRAIKSVIEEANKNVAIDNEKAKESRNVPLEALENALKNDLNNLTSKKDIVHDKVFNLAVKLENLLYRFNTIDQSPELRKQLLDTYEKFNREFETLNPGIKSILTKLNEIYTLSPSEANERIQNIFTSLKLGVERIKFDTLLNAINHSKEIQPFPRDSITVKNITHFQPKVFFDYLKAELERAQKQDKEKWKGFTAAFIVGKKTGKEFTILNKEGTPIISIFLGKNNSVKIKFTKKGTKDFAVINKAEKEQMINAMKLVVNSLQEMTRKAKGEPVRFVKSKKSKEKGANFLEIFSDLEHGFHFDKKTQSEFERELRDKEATIAHELNLEKEQLISRKEPILRNLEDNLAIAKELKKGIQGRKYESDSVETLDADIGDMIQKITDVLSDTREKIYPIEKGVDDFVHKIRKLNQNTMGSRTKEWENNLYEHLEQVNKQYLKLTELQSEYNEMKKEAQIISQFQASNNELSQTVNTTIASTENYLRSSEGVLKSVQSKQLLPEENLKNLKASLSSIVDEMAAIDSSKKKIEQATEALMNKQLPNLKIFKNRLLKDLGRKHEALSAQQSKLETREQELRSSISKNLDEVADSLHKKLSALFDNLKTVDNQLNAFQRRIDNVDDMMLEPFKKFEEILKGSNKSEGIEHIEITASEYTAELTKTASQVQIFEALSKDNEDQQARFKDLLKNIEHQREQHKKVILSKMDTIRTNIAKKLAENSRRIELNIKREGVSPIQKQSLTAEEFHQLTTNQQIKLPDLIKSLSGKILAVTPLLEKLKKEIKNLEESNEQLVKHGLVKIVEKEKIHIPNPAETRAFVERLSGSVNAAKQRIMESYTNSLETMRKSILAKTPAIRGIHGPQPMNHEEYHDFEATLRYLTINNEALVVSSKEINELLSRNILNKEQQDEIATLQRSITAEMENLRKLLDDKKQFLSRQQREILYPTFMYQRGKAISPGTKLSKETIQREQSAFEALPKKSIEPDKAFAQQLHHELQRQLELFFNKNQDVFVRWYVSTKLMNRERLAKMTPEEIKLEMESLHSTINAKLFAEKLGPDMVRKLEAMSHTLYDILVALPNQSITDKIKLFSNQYLYPLQNVEKRLNKKSERKSEIEELRLDMDKVIKIKDEKQQTAELARIASNIDKFRKGIENDRSRLWNSKEQKDLEKISKSMSVDIGKLAKESEKLTRSRKRP